MTSLESYSGDSESYTPEAYAANAKQIEKQGFRLLKFDLYPGFPAPGNRQIENPLSRPDLQYCVRIVECVRSALKNETGLALDLGGSGERWWTTSDAIRLARAFEPYGLDWIENPVQGTNVEALAEVTRSTAIPVLYSYTQPRNMRQLAREETTLFYGWYSNRTRGYRKRHGLLGDASRADPAADESDGTPLEVRRSWARLIRQVYEVDPLLCSQCGGRMKVIAVIEPACADTADRRPAVVRQILDHLGLPPSRPAFARHPTSPMTWGLTSPASAPTNPSLTGCPSPIRCSASLGRSRRGPKTSGGSAVRQFGGSVVQSNSRTVERPNAFQSPVRACRRSGGMSSALPPS